MTDDQKTPEIQAEIEPAVETEQEPQPETVEPETETPTQDQWREALELAVQQRDEYLNMAQRAQADFINFKRRNAQTRADAYDEGVRETLAALLPALDNLDRALSALGDEADSQLAEGVRMTRRQMFDSMAKLGLQEISALNQPFDPDLHHAVMRASEGEPGTVLEVFEKGYKVKERIIRYAMVKVAVEKT